MILAVVVSVASSLLGYMIADIYASLGGGRLQWLVRFMKIMSVVVMGLATLNVFLLYVVLLGQK